MGRAEGRAGRASRDPDVDAAHAGSIPPSPRPAPGSATTRALQATIDRWFADAVQLAWSSSTATSVADFITTTVERWDAEETTDRLELQVGRDLQFIRINGTVVGGLVGLAIYVVSQFL